MPLVHLQALYNMQAVYAAILVIALLGVTVGLTIWNKKTPVPEGCENLEPDCNACGIASCALRKQKVEAIQND